SIKTTKVIRFIKFTQLTPPTTFFFKINLNILPTRSHRPQDQFRLSLFLSSFGVTFLHHAFRHQLLKSSPSPSTDNVLQCKHIWVKVKIFIL
ncbi:hypothetical protein KSS87_017722, partial [Heliosperma pusillum]